MILGYTRVSTTEQAANGTTSLQEQERIIRGYAMTRGITAFDLQIFTDAGISGSMPLKLRPAGADLIEMAKPGDTLVAAKLDRMFRNSIDAMKTYEFCLQNKIDLVLFDLGIEPVTKEGTMSKVIYTVMAAFADLDRSRIRERMLDGKKAKLARGGHAGGSPPFGWHISGQGRFAKLELDEGEQKVIREVLALRDKPIAAVVKEINAKGFRTRKGYPFMYSQIKRVLETHASAH